MAKLPKYYKIHNDGLTVELEPIYTDLVPVVRCKECIQGFRKNEESKLNFYWCDKWRNIVRDCDFCSFGEKREDGDGK